MRYCEHENMNYDSFLDSGDPYSSHIVHTAHCPDCGFEWDSTYGDIRTSLACWAFMVDEFYHEGILTKVEAEDVNLSDKVSNQGSIQGL
jgi:hypothetical protein